MSNNKRTALRTCEYEVKLLSGEFVKCGCGAIAAWDLTVDGSQQIYVCEEHDHELSVMDQEEFPCPN